MSATAVTILVGAICLSNMQKAQKQAQKQMKK